MNGTAMPRFAFRALALLISVIVISACSSQFVGDNRHMVPLSRDTLQRLAAMGSSPSEPMVIRVYKQNSELEVWKRTNTGSYALFKTYEVCNWSGELGPKFREGDYQSPEGFYDVTPALMNPKSSYWLSFNVGFPNKFDQAWGRTGTNLMIHGDCKSVGCYAVTDDQIKEIYALAREVFSGGNRSFPGAIAAVSHDGRQHGGQRFEPPRPLLDQPQGGHRSFRADKTATELGRVREALRIQPKRSTHQSPRPVGSLPGDRSSLAAPRSRGTCSTRPT
jgi:hypothetical protein